MRAVAFARWVCLSAVISVAAEAQYLDVPLTPREQTSALANASSRVLWSRLNPTRTAGLVVAPPFQHDYRARYLTASLNDRTAIAQTIGEEGVERYAAGQGLRTLLGPRGHSSPVGPDSVFWNRLSGKVRVLEAKGGSSALKWTYGSLQGTNANAIRSAGGMLSRSGASGSEMLQAARVIRAAQNGHLETYVVRTSHVLGTPRAPVQAGGLNVDNVANEARQIERDVVRRNPKLGTVFRKAGSQHRMDRLTYRRAASGSRLAWVKPTGLKEIPASAGRPSMAPLSRSLSKGFLRVGNRLLLPVGVGVAGVTAIVTYRLYATGAMSYPEFIDNSVGPATFLAFTGGGAVIGGTLLGIGAIPGAAIGAVLALPFQFDLEWVKDMYYREFNEARREAVDEAVEAMYLWNPTPFSAQKAP